MIRNILGWIAAFPLLVGMVLGPFTPYFFGIIGATFGLGLFIGAYWL